MDQATPLMAPTIQVDRSPFQRLTNVDHLKNEPTNKTPRNYMRRSFSPALYQFSFISPAISPIAPSNLKDDSFSRMFLNSTQNEDLSFTSENDSGKSDAIDCEMPPPHPKKIIKRTSGEFSCEGVEKLVRRIEFSPSPTASGIDLSNSFSDLNLTLSTVLNQRISIPGMLMRIGLGKYIKQFQTQGIDNDEFFKLTNDDLINLGICDPSDRKKLLKLTCEF